MGTITIKNANIITVGVYIFANFVINFSVCAFFSVAFSTKSNILLTVDSPNSFVTSTSIRPFVLIEPLNISFSTEILRGMDSPVNADVSIKASPFITLPSKGTFSPGFITIISPIFTSFGYFFIILSSCFTFANSGFIFIKLSIDFFDLSSAYSSNISPI